MAVLNKIKEQSNRTKEKYSQKYVTPEEAVKVIKSNDRIYIQSGCAYPQRLVEAMVARAPELFDVELCHLMVFGEAPYMKPEMEGHFRHNGFFLGGNTRKHVNAGKADFMPIFLSEIPYLIKHDTKHKVDVVFIQVSPPDMHGFCSMGVAVDCTKAAVHVAKYVIAQINPRMPRVHGDSFIHINDIDFAFEYEQPLQELPGMHAEKDPEETKVFEKIGQNIADLIEDGSTLQMGIGAIPDAVLARLTDRKDLGIHTEMFSDGAIPLIESGVINCDKKTLLRGKIVTSFVLGSHKLFEYIHENPFVEMRTTEFVNDPFTIARNDKMIAINSCLQVDMTGQVCSDSIGYNFYSGFGGQVDFIRGAARSKGGKPIIALQSTAKKGTISRIVPRLEEGAGVTTSRGDVHWVVTEYGAVDLHGMNVRERVHALINIAHPDFREEIERAAKEKKYI
ncbi:MAG: acetyl-CoA hydrolase/transferase family protein [Ignavibacteria bacterium]|nr:acetyl-CoA hydrolase/transferase family protein [Ignavibacteria bacterium]